MAPASAAATAREVTLDDGDEMIDSNDAWAVIKAYFQQHGLVSQ